jgi:uncharacterized protein (TIGR02246 family)
MRRYPDQTGRKIMATSTLTDLVTRQAQAWQAADPEAIVRDFAPDGRFIAPGGRWQGRAAIGAAAADFFAHIAAVRISITRILVDGDQGAVEWTWSEQRLGSDQWHTVEDAIVFEVRHGQLIYWREYFDTASP